MSQPETEYRCPGESRSISRAVHLGRLARFYRACRQCPHARDVRHLPPHQARRWGEVQARPPDGPCFDDEGVAGVWHNQLQTELLRQCARALAVQARRTAASPSARIALAVGSDGGPLAAQAVAAVIEAVRWTGCGVIDVGAVSAPCLAVAIDHWQAAGALLVGNPLGEASTAGLKLWLGPQPVSAGHGLEAIRDAARGPIDRPTRAYGPLARVAADEPYLAGLADHFHGLRPLRIVLHTTCPPVERYLGSLASRVACQVIEATGPEVPDVVRARSAHFGVAIEDDGEQCRVFDEQGRAVSPQRLLLACAGHHLARQPGAAIVLEPGAEASLREPIERWGGRVVDGDHSRARMAQAMRDHAAVLGGGAGRRLWHHCAPPLPDALHTLTRLLLLLSLSDRPLSSVLDSAPPAD